MGCFGYFNVICWTREGNHLFVGEKVTENRDIYRNSCGHQPLTLELTTSKETFCGVALGTASQEKQKEMGNMAVNVKELVPSNIILFGKKSVALTSHLEPDGNLAKNAGGTSEVPQRDEKPNASAHLFPFLITLFGAL